MFLALALSAAFVPPTQAANELASLHWGHPQANPHRSSSVALPGVTARPRELWRREFDAVLSPLVARGGVVFAVVRDGRREELVAFDAATGASLDEVDPRARDAEEFWIAVDAQHIAVVGADGAHLFRFDREDGFNRVASTREAMQADALLLPHALVVRRPDGRLQMLDRDKLEPHGEIDLGASQPSWYEGHLVAIAPSSSGRQLTLDRVACRRDGEAWILDEHAEPLGRVLDGELDRRDGEVRAPGPIKLPRSRNPIGPYRPAWFLPTLGGVKSEEGEIFPGLVWPSAGGLAPLHHVPAATGSFLLGLNEAGDLIELQPEGTYRTRFARAELPQEGCIGPASIADEVVYFQNWAFHIRNRKVLWCLPELKPDGPLVPVAGGFLVARSGAAVVGLGAGEPASDAQASEAAPAGP